MNYECVFVSLSDGKRIPTWETLRQELVVCPLLCNHGVVTENSSYDGSVSVRHIVQPNRQT
jgi:hypothetical protein